MLNVCVMCLGVAPCNTQYGTCAYSEEDIFTCQCRNDDQGARCDGTM